MLNRFFETASVACLVRRFFTLPVVFLREFFRVYWEIATKPGWNWGDRLMARYFWPLCVIIIVTLPWTTPQRVKLEKETRPQQEKPQPQAVSPEKGTTSLGASKNDLVRVNVTAEVGGVAPDEDRSGEIQDQPDKIEGPDVHILKASTNDLSAGTAGVAAHVAITGDIKSPEKHERQREPSG